MRFELLERRIKKTEGSPLRDVWALFRSSYGFNPIVYVMKFPSLAVFSLSCSLIFWVGCQTPGVEKAGEAEQEKGVRFVVSFPAEIRAEALSGRVLLFFSENEKGEPRKDLNWFDPSPVFAVDVENLEPGEVVEFTEDDLADPDALAFPVGLGRIEPGIYQVQALINHDQTRRDFNDGPGNLYSRPSKVEISRGLKARFDLVANQVVLAEEGTENEWVKLVKVRSELLSDFHGRDVFLRAAVLLPYGYEEETERQYPAYYEVPGFGGRHLGLLNRPSKGGHGWKAWENGTNPYRGFEIVLDPDVPLGHSVFADSANNGPVGEALTTELIPVIEERFRIIAEPSARFVGGHSSGGWSSLWLQVTYPNFFGGCWSTAPDPVDFRAFQTMNLYEDTNGHWTPAGQPRPVGRSRHEVKLLFPKFNHYEYVLGWGGQLDSFDAVFSPRGEDGYPLRVMDKLTGKIDHEVVDYWKRYDIRLQLESNWATLGPRLQGKLHVIGGGWDTFYLNPALEMLQDFLATKAHGGYVEILPGSHGSFRTKEFGQRIYREMADQFAKREQ